MPVSEALLLDTHVWIWLHDGGDRLGKSPALGKIESARDNGGVLVSIISVWEIGMLVAKNRLRLRNDVGHWTTSGLEKPGMRLQGMSVGVAIQATRLPGEFHPDPADQILVATARELDIPIVTADAKILAYAKAGHVKAIEV